MVNTEYVRLNTLSESLDFLAANSRKTIILAGGTDIMVDLRANDLHPKYLLDVSRLDELKGIELNDQGLCIGAGVTMSEIYHSEILGGFAPALQKSAYNFASKQIRNVATIGGNAARCSPCGDTIPPLIIHEARAIAASKKGLREVPIENIASGPYACSLCSDEIITRFILRPVEADFADFQKIGRRKELAVARISMAVMASRDQDGKIEFLRFSLGACTPTPTRIEAVEEFLTGKTLTRELIWEAGHILTEKMVEITGIRGSSAYKKPAMQGLFMRMLDPMA